jgi:hypothetical protein
VLDCEISANIVSSGSRRKRVDVRLAASNVGLIDVSSPDGDKIISLPDPVKTISDGIT